VRRLAGDVRRRFERSIPIKLPGRPVDHTAPAVDIAPDAPPGVSEQDAAARIDAARERLRATIQPRDDHVDSP